MKLALLFSVKKRGNQRRILSLKWVTNSPCVGKKGCVCVCVKKMNNDDNKKGFLDKYTREL